MVKEKNERIKGIMRREEDKGGAYSMDHWDFGHFLSYIHEKPKAWELP